MWVSIHLINCTWIGEPGSHCNIMPCRFCPMRSVVFYSSAENCPQGTEAWRKWCPQKMLFDTALIKHQKPGKEDPCTLGHLCRLLQCWWLCVTLQYRQHLSYAASPSLLWPGAHPGIVTGHTSVASVSDWGREKWRESERQSMEQVILWLLASLEMGVGRRWGYIGVVLSNNHCRSKLLGVALNQATY